MLRKIRDHYWVAETRAQAESQFGEDVPLQTGDLLTISAGDDAGDYSFDAESSATAAHGIVAVTGHSGRFLLSETVVRIVEDRADASATKAFANSAGQLFVSPQEGVYRGI